MNPIARLVQSDPNGAHRIVRSGRQDELPVQFPRFRRFRKVLGIERVVWIVRNHGHVQFSDRPLLRKRRDAAWKMRHEIGIFIEHLERPVFEVDAGERCPSANGRPFHARDRHRCVGDDVGPVDRRIEALDQVGMTLSLLSDQFEDAFIVEPVLLRLFEPGLALRTQARQVIRRDRVIRERRGGEQQTLPGGSVKGAGYGQVFLKLKGDQCQARLRSRHAVQ